MKTKAPLSALAQLVVMYETHCSITSTAELAEATGYSDRSIRSAKAEIHCQTERKSIAGNVLPPGDRLPEAEIDCRKSTSVRQSTSGNVLPEAEIDFLPEKERSPHTPLKEKQLSPVVKFGGGSFPVKPKPEPNEISALYDQLSEAAGDALCPTALNLLVVSEPQGWLDSGCDLHRDVVPTIKALSSRLKPQSINSWKYFERAVLDAFERRKQGLPAAPGQKPLLTDEQAAANTREIYRSLCKTYADTKRWMSGRIKMADVPAEILAEFDLAPTQRAEVA